MQWGSTRPAAKKHLPEECNPTAEWHYCCTIQQAIAGAILFSPTRNRWLKWLRLHAARDHGVWDLAGLWAQINRLTIVDHRRWRERQVTHGFAKKNGSTMVTVETKAQRANGSIAKAPSDLGLLQLTLTALTALSCRPHNTLDLSWSQF